MAIKCQADLGAEILYARSLYTVSIAIPSKRGGYKRYPVYHHRNGLSSFCDDLPGVAYCTSEGFGLILATFAAFPNAAQLAEAVAKFLNAEAREITPGEYDALYGLGVAFTQEMTK